MSPYMFDKVAAAVAITGVQIAALIPIFDALAAMNIVFYVGYSLLSCWCAWMAGSQAGFKRGMAVAERIYQ